LQRIAGLRHSARARVQVRFGAGHLAFGLCHVEAAVLMAFAQPACQFERLPPVGQRVLGQLPLLVGQAFREVGIGHRADQRDLRGPAPLLAGQVACEGRVGQRPQAAEQVDLECAQSDIDTKLVLRGRRNRGIDSRVGRRALPCGGSGGIDAGELRGTLNAVLRLGGLRGQRGKAKVTVVGQRQFDQALQALVTEHGAPAQIGCLRAFAAGRLYRVRLRHRQVGFDQRRRQRAGRQGHDNGENEKSHD